MSSALRRSLRLARLGAGAGLRSPGLRLLGLGGAVAVALYAWNQGGLAAVTGNVLATWLGRLYGLGACFWFAYAAVRDQDRRGAAFASKPVDGAVWVLVTWAAGMAVWLCLLGAAFLAAAVAQLPAAGGMSLVAHGLAFGRAALTLSLAATLSFSLSRLVRSPLGGVIIAFAWFCSLAGLQFLPAYLRLDYFQNWPLFVPSAALLLVLAAVMERGRRGELRWGAAAAYALPAAAVALLLGAAAGAGAAYRRAPDPAHETRPLWEAMPRQHLTVGARVPGFWLPDGKGGLVRTAPYNGKVLLIYLFAADDLTAARTLPALDALAAELGPRGVQPIAISLSPDWGDGWLLANAGGYRFPVASDPSTINVTAPPQSAVAVAYNAQLLPLLAITDRRRQAQEILTAEPFYDLAALRHLVKPRLDAEPE